MKKRCVWLNLKNEEYINYHDREWGRPVHDDQVHFEMLILEGAQTGLSWETVLNKREHYRKVFHQFDPKKVSKITPKRVASLLQDPGIIRNRLKVESTITNAQAFLQIQKECGSFDSYIWSFCDKKVIYNSYKKTKDFPSETSLSAQISKDLKKRGFRFVGSTIIYAYMQAAGMVQDHSQDCYLNNKKLRRLTSRS